MNPSARENCPMQIEVYILYFTARGNSFLTFLSSPPSQIPENPVVAGVVQVIIIHKSLMWEFQA